MGKPVAIRKIIVEFNVININILRDALVNYEDYLDKSLMFENDIKLTKKAIRRRIRYTQDLRESIEL